MPPGSAAIFGVAMLVLLILLACRPRSATARYVLLGGVILCCCLVAATFFQIPESTETIVSSVEVTNRPIEDPANGYLGSDACQSCHAHEHATWHSSYHRTMTQLATPETVIGEFDTSLSVPDLSFDLRREGDEFYFKVEQLSETSSGPHVVQSPNYQIVMTTGSHHMQVCWYSMGDDTRVLGMLPFMYLKRDRRWIPLNSSFMTPPLPLGNENGRWNTTCIKCHATYGRVNVGGPNEVEPGETLDPNVDTRVAEFGISCEACHGPGEQHVRKHQMETDGRAGRDVAGEDETIVHPGKLSHKKSAQICGQCHSNFQLRPGNLATWHSHGFDYQPGQDLASSSVRELVRCFGDSVSEFPENWQSSFWPDGMTRVSSNEYNGLIESPCFQRGELSCIRCHQLHQAVDDRRPAKEWANDQLGVDMDSNEACTQCHHEFRDVDALASHTHHSVESAGSSCYNCHMPHTTYGLMKAIRSHEISSPDVNVNLATGRPNACNQCHLDKTLAWSAEHLSQWYGIDAPELTDDQSTISASVLWLLRGDAGQRALAAWTFGWEDAQEISGSRWMTPYLAQLLQDPYDTVRYIAWHSLRQLPEFEPMEYDFVGNPELRAETGRLVVDRWSERQQSIPEMSGEAILLDGSGKLRIDEFNRILEQRDDRDVLLNE